MRSVAILLLGLVLVAPACGGDDDATPAADGSRTTDDAGEYPVPPGARIVAAGREYAAGLGTYCWNAEGRGVCADDAAPSCEDEAIPHVAVDQGATLRFELAFDPSEPPTLQRSPSDARTLAAGRTVEWPVDLPPGSHPIGLFVRAGARGDVSYTACLEVPLGTGETSGTTAAAAELPPETGLPLVTVGGVEHEPVAPPPTDTDDCVRRWNAAPNAETRAAVAKARPTGVFVRLDHEPGMCSIFVIRPVDEGPAGVDIFVELSAGLFDPSQGGASGITAPPERFVEADGTIGELFDPLPPYARVADATAGFGSFCWRASDSSGVCADSAAPQCGDGYTPLVIVQRGEPVRFTLAFEPAEAPGLSVFTDGAPNRSPTMARLEAGATPTWTPDLPPGRYPISLFVRGPGGDVSYTACVEVRPGG